MTFIVTQSENVVSTVDYAITGGTAVSGTEYQPVASGTLVFTGVGSQNIPVTLIGNQLYQSDRTIVLTLSNAVGSLITVNTGTGTIADDDAATSIAVTSGNNQSAIIGEAFGAPITATVRNAANNPVQNVTVTFTAPAFGASFTPTPITVITNSSGIASTGTITANGTDGSNYSVGIAALGGTAPATNATLSNFASAAVTISSPTINEGDNGASPTLTFTVTLTGSTATTSSVNYAITGGSAVSGTDFQPLASGTLTFNAGPGPQTKTLNIAVLGNQLVQSDRNIIITLSNAQNVILGNTTGTGTIVDDDAPAQIAVSGGNNQTTVISTAFANPLSAIVTNAAGNPVQGANVTFRAPASGASATPTPVTVTTNSGGVASSGTLTANGTAGSFSVTAETQGTSLQTTSFSLTSTATTGPSLSINNPIVPEGDNGASTIMPFTVTLTGDTASPVTVNYSITGGTAVSGTDYQPLASGTLTFPAGTGPQSQNINVTIIGNQRLQSDRTLILTLSSPTGATISNATGTGSITEDDQPVNIAVSSGNNQSASTGQTFGNPLTVIVSNFAGHPVEGAAVTFTAPAAGPSLTATTFSGTTNSGGIASSGSITANSIAGSYTVSAAAAGAGSTPFSLTNNAGPTNNTPTLSINDVSANEGNSGTTALTFTVTLSAPSSQTVTVNFATNSGTATAGSDFTSTSGTLTFAPGELSKTITVFVTGDTAVEANETFTVTLSSPTNATLARAVGTATIVNDDSGDTIPPLPSGQPIALAVLDGNQPITIVDASNGTSFTVRNPLYGFAGPVSVALGDVTGDGKADLVVAAGKGGEPRVVVIDGTSGRVVIDFYAYDRSFTGGVNLALADLTGDGRADIVTGAGPGGGANVRIFDGATFAMLVDVMMFPMEFDGGVSVAVGDVNGDGALDVITGAGAGGGPHVKAFDPRNLRIVSDFFAFDASFKGGVNVAAGDLNADRVAEIIAGAGPGGSPEVRVFRGTDNRLLLAFQAFETSFQGGVDVSVQRVPNFERPVILAAAGKGGAPRIRGFDFLTSNFVYETYLGNPFSDTGATVS